MRVKTPARGLLKQWDAPPPPVYLAPDRYVTVGVYAAISGRTEKSIRRKIEDGKWLDRREFIRDPDGTVLIDREGVQRWALRKS
jgi:hypothetical protein